MHVKEYQMGDGKMEASVMETRVEKDFLGTKKVPVDAYYGIQTLRAVENFPITGNKLH